MKIPIWLLMDLERILAVFCHKVIVVHQHVMEGFLSTVYD